jgi:hypothetical protein
MKSLFQRFRRAWLRKTRVVLFSEADGLNEQQIKAILPSMNSPVTNAILQVLRAEYATWSQLAISPKTVGTAQQSHAAGGACAVADLIALITELTAKED